MLTRITIITIYAEDQKEIQYSVIITYQIRFIRVKLIIAAKQKTGKWRTYMKYI